jgi:integrase
MPKSKSKFTRPAGSPRPSPFPPYPARPHAASGQARVKWRGRQYYLGAFGSPASREKHAGLVLAAAGGSIGGGDGSPTAGGSSDGNSITIRGLFARYADATESQRDAGDATTIELRKVTECARVCNRLYGELPAGDFRASHLEAVRVAMLVGSWMTDRERAQHDKRRPGKPHGWCRNVVNRQIVRVRTVFRWAELHGYVPDGRWHHLCALPRIAGNDRRARNTHPREPAGWEHVQPVLRAVAPCVAAMIEIQWWTGMRPSEVVRMRACDVVTVDQGDGQGDGQPWTYRLASSKSAWRGAEFVGEVVPIGPECQRVLRPWLDAARNRGGADGSCYLFQPSRRRKSTGYTVASYGRAIARGCVAAGVPHFSAYQLRHSAKRRIEAELGTAAASAILRHRSLETTRRYAAGQNRELAADAARKVG